MSADGSDQHYESYKSILLAILPKGPAVISIACSFALIRKVVLHPSNSKKIQDRIMLGLSVSDVLMSFDYFLGTWLVPKGTVGVFGPVFGASGNDGTCNLSGFFTQFAIASPMYNGALSCYYLFRIYFNKQESELRKIEKYFHIIPISFAFCTALFALCFNMYGSVEWLCWINPSPQTTGVQRAYKWFQWTFLFGPVWACVAFQSIVMYLLFRKMRAFERAMNLYSFDTQRKAFEESMMQGKKIGDKPSTNISTADTVDRDLPSFVENRNTQVSTLSMLDGVSELQNDEVDHQHSKDSEKKESKAPSDDEENGDGENVDSENDENDVESMVRIDNIGNSFGTISTLENKVSTVEKNDIEGTNCLSAVKEENEDEGHKAGETTSNSYKQIERDIDSDSVGRCDYSSEEEKTEIEPNPTKRSSVTFEDEEEGLRQSMLHENQQDSFLPNLNDGENCNDDDDDDDDNMKPGVHFSAKLGSIISKMAGGGRSSVSSSSSQQRRNIYTTNKKSRTIAIQGILYVCAFYVTWLFPTIQRFTEFANKSFFPVQIIDSTLLPMQGFFNFLVYIRPQFVKYRETHNEHGFWKSLREVTLNH